MNDMKSKKKTGRTRGNLFKMNLSFVGSGFLSIYYAGVVACFRQYAPPLLQTEISGASAGAIVGCWILCDVPLDSIVSYFLQSSKEIRKKILGPFTPNFDVNKSIYEVLDKFLPENAHLKVNGKLHVSVTKASTFKNVMISHFDSREDLIKAVLASSFVPLISGLKPPKYKGTRYIDGAFSNNVPILDENTVTICPFSGKCDICPRNDHLLIPRITVHALELSNRTYKIFFPISFKRLLKYCRRGYNDTLRFLLENNLIGCARCLDVRHTSAVSEATDENYELGFQCEECIRLREEASTSKLPEDIVTLFQEDTEQE